MNLTENLEKYCQEYYPLHMPGHKRRIDPTGGFLPVDIDTTEVTGVDDLHNATGILKEAQDRTAALYSSKALRYLVGGSTLGVLASIYAVAGRNGEIIASRGCHKSVWHAAELLNLKVDYLLPPMIPGYEVFGSIRPEDVEKSIKVHPDARAVVITSPTYEGILSDIRPIAEICHRAGIPLIVDEAHGAHLIGRFRGDGGFWPEGAVSCGADLVIQSAHKTLPSLTQTAWLHINGNLADPGIVDHALDIFETSSPSYPLMASLDAATGLLTERGDRLFKEWQQMLVRFYKETAGLESLEILNAPQNRGKIAGFAYSVDPGKIFISSRRAGLPARELAGVLRQHFGFETEMSVGYGTLAMTSLADDPDALAAFAEALLEIDDDVSFGDVTERRTKGKAEGTAEGKTAGMAKEKEEERAGEAKKTEENTGRKEEGKAGSEERGIERTANGVNEFSFPACRLRITEAMEKETEEIPLSGAAGRIAGEIVMAYPPGVPLLLPGEMIDERMIRYIHALQNSGTEVWHRSRRHGEAGRGAIIVVKD